MDRFDLNTLQYGLFAQKLHVKISPLVPAIMIDHYMHLDKKNVGIGLIYGKSIGGALHITNAIGLRSEVDKNGIVSIDKELGYKLHNLTLHVNPSQRLIGVFQLHKELTLLSYAVYSNIFASQKQQIGSRFPKFRKMDGILDMPLLLTLDPTLEGDIMDISVSNSHPQVYTNFKLGICKEDVAAFQKVPCSVDVKKKSKNGLDLLIAGQQDYDTLSTLLIEKELKIEEAESRRYLLSNPEKIALSVAAASQLLQRCKDYAKDASKGKIKGDIEAAKLMSHITRSGFGEDASETQLTKKQEMFMMIKFLTEMTRTQVKLGEKINAQIY